jgi:subtilisin-like proprotein convertase family protein
MLSRGPLNWCKSSGTTSGYSRQFIGWKCEAVEIIRPPVLFLRQNTDSHFASGHIYSIYPGFYSEFVVFIGSYLGNGSYLHGGIMFFKLNWPNRPSSFISSTMSLTSFVAVILFLCVGASGQNIFNNSNPITINDLSTASPYPSTITVSGLTGTIPSTAGSVKVTLTGFTHSFPDDVGIVLVGPTGAALLLQDGAGDEPDMTNVTYSLSDAGTSPLPDLTAWPAGIYKPTTYVTGDSFPAPGPGTTYGSPGPFGGGTATFSSVFGGTNPNGVWKLFVGDFVSGDSGQISGGWSIEFTSNATPPPTRRPFDFDGDGKTDIGIVRPNNGSTEWWISRSSDSNVFATVFGLATDIPAPGDFTGDGKTDIAIFRPSNGNWFILRSEDFTFLAFPFGANGDIPMPADYDGDGKTDPAVFRPSSNTWFIDRTSDGQTTIAQFGQAGDQPVAADYDGDGKADIAIYRLNNGAEEWWIQRSSAGLFATVFGAAGDKAVPGDYTGDGKTDIAVWRPSNGNWLILRSEDFSFLAFPWGAAGDIPAPGDYDGDGKFDATVFRPSSASWFVNRTGGAGPLITNFGAVTDKPVAGVFVR